MLNQHWQPVADSESDSDSDSDSEEPVSLEVHRDGPSHGGGKLERSLHSITPPSLNIVLECMVFVELRIVTAVKAQPEPATALVVPVPVSLSA